jgi:CheY-like chemotaxis protein
MGHKILLADDSITVQKIVKLTFSDEGVEVVAVGNGEQAVQQLRDMRPDLVMADVFMPGKDGYEVCHYVKTHPELCRTPVILLVHAFEPFDQQRATSVGADTHLTKPFQSIRSLITTVKELMDPAGNQTASAPAPFQTETAAAPPTSDSIQSAPEAQADDGQAVGPGAPASAMEETALSLPLTLETEPASAADGFAPDFGFAGPAAHHAFDLPAFGAADLTVSSAPLAQTPGSEDAGEVLELEETLRSAAPAQTETDELLEEVTTSLRADATANESAPDATTAPADTLPILAEVEMPPLPSEFDPFASASAKGADSESETTEPLTLPSLSPAADSADFALVEGEPPTNLNSMPEPGAAAESDFTSEPGLLDGHDYAEGQASEVHFDQETMAAAVNPPPFESQPAMSERQPEKQDLDLGSVSAQAEVLTAYNIPPALIDEIVNRVVERLSEKAIQEIAWEVVPEMAELIIRQQLAEKMSH